MRLLFVDKDNTQLSQLAEAWAKRLNRKKSLMIQSAGLKKGATILPAIEKVISDAGLEKKGLSVKSLEQITPPIDIVVYIGVSPNDKISPTKGILQWHLDLEGDDYEKSSGILQKRVKDLLIDIKKGNY